MRKGQRSSEFGIGSHGFAIRNLNTWFAVVIICHLNLAKPFPLAKGFKKRLFCSKARCKVLLGKPPFLAIYQFFLREDSVFKSIPPSLHCFFKFGDMHNVYADAVNHLTNSFISLTARSMPTNTLLAIMLKPMANSSISLISATFFTL